MSTGSVEHLVTNIFDDGFSKEDFKKLYNLRWGIGTNYNDIKNKLEVENFTGISPLAVKQDFFATMFLRNMVSMMIYENKEEINKVHNAGKNKYRDKANVNNVVSLLKEEVIKMMCATSACKRKKY